MGFNAITIYAPQRELHESSKCKFMEDLNEMMHRISIKEKFLIGVTSIGM